MSSIWDDPDMEPNDAYVRFENVGDEVTGTILSITKRTFEDGKKAAQFLLDTGRGQKTLTASQSHLQRLMWHHKPDLGDTITVRFDSVEKMTGGRTRKLFTVRVDRANGREQIPAAWPTAAGLPEAPAFGKPPHQEPPQQPDDSELL